MPEQSIGKWLNKRPYWLQEAAKRLFKGQKLSTDEMAEICIKEAKGKFEDPEFDLPDKMFEEGDSKLLRLTSIENIQGINALSPKKPLLFGSSNLSIVYGLNGSGKSGYVRILKHACGARNPGYLHPNVFAKKPSDQKCEISYEKDGLPIKFEWTAESGPFEEICGIDIFDSMCGRVYVTGENEVTYEPPILHLLTDLTAICESVWANLNQREDQLPSIKPEIPIEYATTKAENWFNKLSSETNVDQIKLNCTWTEANEKDLNGFQKRLAEESPLDKAIYKRKQKQHLEGLIQTIEEHVIALSDENCIGILKLKKAAENKKNAAKAAADQIFQEADLDGIGTELWKQLWEKARQYSEQEAYKDFTFPYTDETARCVLCQQPLSDFAKVRFQSFEDYVKGSLEKDAVKAEIALKEAIKEIPDTIAEDSLREKIDASGWTEEAAVDTLLTIFSALKKRYEKLLLANEVQELPALPECNGWLKKAREFVARYEKIAQELDKDARSDNREELKRSVLELKAKKWISQQQSMIGNEVERLKKIKVLKRAKKLANTTALSSKKGKIAESLITEAFIERFDDELTHFGAHRVRVKLVKSRVKKGRVLHKLVLCDSAGCVPADILSEGEFRIIAIASFLADVTGKTKSSPFVFDDPISSLDQDYEEAVVRRLVELSKDRQLIVFTHRLSMLGLIRDYAKNAGIKPNVVCVRQEVWGSGEPGETPLFVKKPEKALNALINDRLVRAEKILDEYGKEEYEPIAKALCSDFRILIERMIESDLLADVVQRYRRAINTMGKIDKLSRINEGDCAFIDEMLTKYSRYEHSQPSEAPIPLPLPDDLKQDFISLKSWRDEFVSRGVN